MIIKDCKCELCCEGDLPGVESHLFSEFLIKETINKQSKANAIGKNAKGNELLFSISPLENAKLFIGRQSTEDGKRVLGKEEFTDEEVEELKSSENFLIDKYLVCTSCEKLFQPIENAFKEIYDLLLSECQKECTRYFELNEEQSVITELFFNMNIWRASTSNKFNLRLDDHNQLCLNELMHSVFIEDLENKNYAQKFLNAKKTYNCLSIILFFSKEEIISPEEINDNLIYSYKSSNPYFVVVNRFIICISTNDFDGIGTPVICRNAIDNLVSFVEHGKNRINYVNEETLENIGKNYAVEFVDEFKKHLIETYTIAFENILGRKPEEREIVEMLEISKNHIGDFYDIKTSEKQLFIKISELIQYKLKASR